MKLICLVENLKNSIGSAERITTKNQSLPLLNAVKISTQEERVKIVSTNLEIGLEIFTTCKIEEPGEIVLPAKLLYSYLNTISENQTKLETKNNNILLKTKNSTSTIKGFNPDEFPLLPKIEKKYSFQATLKNLQHAFTQVLPAVSFSDIKPEISSIVMSFSEDTVKIAATDSFRLAEKTIHIKQNNNSNTPKNPILIPYRAIQEMVRLPSESSQVEIFFNENHVVFKTDKFSLISRLTEGVFPDYNSIIPKNFTTKVQIQKTALTDAIKTTSIFVGRLNDITISFKEDDKLSIHTAHESVGEHSVVLDAKIEGESVQSTFNYRYILDGLAQLGGKNIFVGFNGNQNPLFIRDDEDESYFYMVMPMRGV